MIRSILRPGMTQPGHSRTLRTPRTGSGAANRMAADVPVRGVTCGANNAPEPVPREVPPPFGTRWTYRSQEPIAGITAFVPGRHDRQSTADSIAGEPVGAEVKPGCHEDAPIPHRDAR